MHRPALSTRAVTLLFGTVLALAFSIGFLSSSASSDPVTLYSNITGVPTSTGSNTGSVGTYSGVNYRTAQPFTAAGGGSPYSIRFWAQCGSINCASGRGQLTILNDSGGHPGATAIAAAQFQSFDQTGSLPNCES